MIQTFEKLKPGTSGKLPVCAIYWGPEYNVRLPEEYGDAKERDKLIVSLATRGWLESNICQVRVASEEQIKANVAHLNKRWSILKADFEENQADSGPYRKLKAFELLRCTKDKKGTLILITPEYIGVTCNRRAVSFEDAIVYCNSQEPKWDIPDFLLNVQVKEYANDIDVMMDQLDENEFQGLGQRQLTDATRFRAGVKMAAAGKLETDFRKRFKAGTGQALFAVIAVAKNVLYRALNIISRVELGFKVNWADKQDYVKGGPIPFKTTYKEPLRAFDKCDTDAFAKKDVLKDLEPDAEGLEEFFRQQIVGVVKLPPMKKRSEIESTSKMNDNVIVQRTAKAILKNNDNDLIAMSEKHYAAACNLCVEICDIGHAEDVEIVLEELKADLVAKHAKVGNPAPQQAEPELQEAVRGDSASKPKSNGGKKS